MITMEIGWSDIDSRGMKIAKSTVAPKEVRIPVGAMSSASEVISAAIESLDASYASKTEKKRAGPGENEISSEMARRILDLNSQENRGDGESAPRNDSIEQFKGFLKLFPNLTTPDIFSSSDGTLRARWNHGVGNTAWVVFPGKQKLITWSVATPRESAYGLRRISGRCANDEDIMYFIEKLGVMCTRAQ